MASATVGSTRATASSAAANATVSGETASVGTPNLERYLVNNSPAAMSGLLVLGWPRRSAPLRRSLHGGSLHLATPVTTSSTIYATHPARSPKTPDAPPAGDQWQAASTGAGDFWDALSSGDTAPPH